MSMSNLLPELVEEILYRVPAMSLKRLRSTCKRWNALFKDQRFAKMHFDTPKQSSFIMLHENKVFPLSVNLLEIDKNIAAPLIEFKCELCLIESSEEIQFHCDGLLLCTTKNGRVVVWNPCTGKTKFIIPRNNSYYHFSMFIGYENNKSCRNYKILRFSLIQDQDTNYMITEFEIYEFLSNTWRVLEVTANLLIRSCGVSLKGNTYWLAANDDYLLSFDFSTERFGYYCLPFERDTHHYCSDEALSIVREDQLSVLHQRHDTNTIEIWVATSNKIDETIVLSWTNFLTINGYKLSGCYHFSSWITFFIAEEKKVVVCCDSSCRNGFNENNRNMILVMGENGVYREICFGESFYKSGLAYILNYVPSLVQIQQSTVMP